MNNVIVAGICRLGFFRVAFGLIMFLLISKSAMADAPYTYQGIRGVWGAVNSQECPSGYSEAVIKQCVDSIMHGAGFSMCRAI